MSEPTIDRVHVTRSRAKPGGIAAESDGTVPFRRARKPPWLKVPAPGGPTYRRLKSMIGVTCDVTVKAPGEVPRSQGKAVRVKDMRKKPN